jgi:uncharacterized protein with ParB-like and HNH nuclease domain/predicted transport protein
VKAKEANLLLFLKASPQFVIPIYQRTYSWSAKECRQLWHDVMSAGRDKAIESHFVGSVVYIEQGIFQVTSQSPLMVIDGQQRLTTVSLLLEALARRLGETEPVDGLSAVKIRSYYLQNPLESGDRRFKLLLTQSDRDTFTSLVRQQGPPDAPSLRVLENFAFFEKQLNGLGDDLEPLWNGLRKLVVVDVALTRGQDNPQLIFESMNSTGRALSQADLIRNFVLMGLERDHQATLYNDHWHPMEQTFGQESYGLHFDRFMRDYLTVKTGEIPNIKAVYEEFKKYASGSGATHGIDALISEVHTFARYYCAMALGREGDPALARTFQRFRELNVDVAYPFLLELYRDYAAGDLAHREFIGLVELVESYVFRRAICAIPTNSLNKTFATLSRAIRRDRYVESVRAAFQLLPSYRRFPSDDEFRREFAIRDVYHLRGRGYWLRRMENHDRKEPVPVDEYTVEHIMPQNENLSAAWRADLGPDWKRVQATKLHTLGNLTLTGYNSEYSDRPFREKRDMPGGFRESPLRLNAGLGAIEVWNEAAIDDRAAGLAAKAASVWAAPGLPADVLADYRTTSMRTEAAVYTLNDHPYLAAGGTTRKLFDALRDEVLALDPCVYQDIRKVRVAFKAEQNIVDVVPQATRLVLTVNVPFHELSDPKGMVRDVTNIEHWGVGPVEVRLDSLDDLPYIIGLVRQALERQLGGPAEQ